MMRHAACAVVVISFLGCTQPEGEPRAKRPETNPGTSVVRLIGAYGLLADERVWRFYPPRFADELAGARTLSEHEPFSLFADMSSRATCFARSDHVLRCLGSAREGGLAGATATDTCEAAAAFWTTVKFPCAKLPVIARVPPVSDVSSSCALTTDGNVWCWGREGRDGPIFAPTRIAGIDGRAHTLSAASDARRVCAILDGGRVACADGRKPGDTARLLSELEQIVALGLGTAAGCFIDNAGVLRCYDERASREPFPSAERINTPLRFSQVSLSPWIGCGVTSERRVACFRLIGDENPELPSRLPMLVPNIDRAIEVSVVSDVVRVRRDDGSVLEGVWPRTGFEPVAP